MNPASGIVAAMALLTVKDIEATRARIAPHLVVTPVHVWRGREIEALLGPETTPVLKLELFQRTGTFKPRGALNVMLNSDPEALARGVTAVSAGNHAIAVAFAAQRLGLSAKVVMLASANPFRVAAARAYGAEVEIAPDGASAFARVEQIQAEEGRAFVHPFEGIFTSLGTATLGAEWVRQTEPMDAVIVPIGGGGLMGGVSAAVKRYSPGTEVIGVEPVGADVMHLSFAAGSPQRMDRIDTIADSLAPPMTTPLSFELCRENVDRLVLIDDDQMRAAMGLLFRDMKLAVEPAGAAATAALVGPLREELSGRRVGLMVCGSNIDPDTFFGQISSSSR